MTRVVLIIGLLTWTVGLQAAYTVSGTVTKVIDGDTLDLKTADKVIRIRLNHIDAPEKGQPYYKRATAYLKKQSLNKVVDVRITKTDRYKRSVGTVYIGKTNINRDMVKQGYAWWYKVYSGARTYRQLERQARSQRRGLWQEAKPTPPWQYRWQNRAKTPQKK